MAAIDIQTSLVLLPDTKYNSSNVVAAGPLPSYEYSPLHGIQTLREKTEQSVISGLLYIPTLSSNTACGNSSGISIPGNVTTLASLPPGSPLVAIFPWTDPACGKAYLDQGVADSVSAAITFQPSGNTIPQASDSSWSVPADAWQSFNPYAVYAITPGDAAIIITDLSYYSGNNISDTPYGEAQIDSGFQPSGLARIMVAVTLPPHFITEYESVGIAVGIIVAVILLIVSVVLFFRARHRREFRERLLRGEVNLEVLGIKKMNVPQKLIDQMPSFAFAANPKNAAADGMFSSSSQPSCPVCLDDFVSGETTVRELPCRHIFHPECIDLYLRDSSSLCPMCKKSALPPGYLPINVDGYTIRRERAIHRMQERERQQAAVLARNGATNELPGTQAADGRPRQDVELATRLTGSATTSAQGLDNEETTAVPAEITAQGVSARRAWYRERLARRQQQAFAEASENARRVTQSRSLWTRATTAHRRQSET